MLAHALKLAAAGILIGGACALAITPMIEAQLFGVRPMDPVTYLGVGIVLLLTAALGAYVPARRAMRVDPAHALRT